MIVRAPADGMVQKLLIAEGEDLSGNIDSNGKLQTTDLTELVHDAGSADGVVSARTVGSSFDTQLAGGDATAQDELPPASTLLTGQVQSSAAGGGNPTLQDGKETAVGRVGYVVLENFGTFFDDREQDPNWKLNLDGELPGGVESPLRSDQEDTQFALLRLATATGSLSTEEIGDRTSAATLDGYVSGLVEVQNPTTGQIDLGRIAAPGEAPNLSLTPVLATNTIAGQAAGIAVGGTGASAYIGADKFGAISTGTDANVGLVSANLLADPDTGKLTIPGRDTGGTELDTTMEHVKWGFFFGDVKTADKNRQHVHLGTFVAGLKASDLKSASGKVDYKGHVIGNVFSEVDGKRALYTAAGTYRDTFDFATSQGVAGELKLEKFDGVTYSGASRLENEVYRGTVSSGTRTGELTGNFVGANVQAPNGKGPAGVIGQFSIRDSSSYRATGTFGGEAQTQ